MRASPSRDKGKKVARASHSPSSELPRAPPVAEEHSATIWATPPPGSRAKNGAKLPVVTPVGEHHAQLLVAELTDAVKGVQLDKVLMVDGCSDGTIKDCIQGRYLPHSVRAGKVVYKKEGQFHGLDVFIYYWDDSDDPNLSGWWFGSSVGGDMVWAYHPSIKAKTPPADSWNVPHDGAIDRTFTVSALSNSRRK